MPLYPRLRELRSQERVAGENPLPDSARAAHQSFARTSQRRLRRRARSRGKLSRRSSRKWTPPLEAKGVATTRARYPWCAPVARGIFAAWLPRRTHMLRFHRTISGGSRFTPESIPDRSPATSPRRSDDDAACPAHGARLRRALGREPRAIRHEPRPALRALCARARDSRCRPRPGVAHLHRVRLGVRGGVLGSGAGGADRPGRDRYRRRATIVDPSRRGRRRRFLGWFLPCLAIGCGGAGEVGSTDAGDPCTECAPAGGCQGAQVEQWACPGTCTRAPDGHADSAFWSCQPANPATSAVRLWCCSPT